MSARVKQLSGGRRAAVGPLAAVIFAARGASLTGVGYEITNQGYLAQNPAGTLCDGHYPNVLTDGLQMTLLEQVVVNDVTNPEDLGVATWLKTAVTIAANNARAPDQNQTADLMVEDGTTGNHFLSSNLVTITAGDTVTALMFVRNGGRYRGWFRVDATGGVDTFGVDYNLSTGTISAHVQGTGVLTASRITPLAGGWYMLWVRGTCNGTSTTLRVEAILADGTGAVSYAGDSVSGTYVWGMTAVHGATNISVRYTPTARALDVLTVPYAPAPQAAWWYVKLVESGMRYVTGKSPRVFELGPNGSAFSSPSLVLFNSGGPYALILHQGSGDVTSTLGAAPSIGDVVELLGILYADGSVELRQALNGGAETTGGRSAAPPGGMPGSWGTAPIIAFGDDAAHVGSQATALMLNLLRHGPGVAVSTIAIARTR